jgi:hypothetical protein
MTIATSGCKVREERRGMYVSGREVWVGCWFSSGTYLVGAFRAQVQGLKVLDDTPKELIARMKVDGGSTTCRRERVRVKRDSGGEKKESFNTVNKDKIWVLTTQDVVVANLVDKFARRRWRQNGRWAVNELLFRMTE